MGEGVCSVMAVLGMYLFLFRLVPGGVGESSHQVVASSSDKLLLLLQQAMNCWEAVSPLFDLTSRRRQGV